MRRLNVSRVTVSAALALILIVMAALVFSLSSVGKVGAQGPPAFLQKVFVTNTEADPVPVSLTGFPDPLPVSVADFPDLAPAPREAYQSTMSTVTAHGAEFASIGFNVPDGKRLVVERASIRVVVPEGQDAIVRINAGGPPGTTQGSHVVTLSSQGVFNGYRVYVGGESVPLWVGPGAGNVSFNVVRSDVGGLMEIDASISGYLEDLP